MGLVKGLKGINAYNDEQEKKRAERDRPKTVWFKINDKQSVDVIFLQELDDESSNYSAKNGVGFLAVEHVNPSDFKRKAVCTMDDEGACYGCERHREDYTLGWKQKTKLYINVLVKDGENDPYVAVLSATTSGQAITPTLIEYAGDDGTITDKWFSIKRNGTSTDTSYTLRAKKEHGDDVEKYELFDLEQVVRQVPYAQQEAHYLDGQVAAKSDESAGSDAPAKSDSDSSSSVVW